MYYIYSQRIFLWRLGGAGLRAVGWVTLFGREKGRENQRNLLKCTKEAEIEQLYKLLLSRDILHWIAIVYSFAASFYSSMYSISGVKILILHTVPFLKLACGFEAEFFAFRKRVKLNHHAESSTDICIHGGGFKKEDRRTPDWRSCCTCPYKLRWAMAGSSTGSR